MQRYAPSLQTRLAGCGAALVATLALAGFIDTLATPDPSPHAVFAAGAPATEVSITPARIDVVGTRTREFAQTAGQAAPVRHDRV